MDPRAAATWDEAELLARGGLLLPARIARVVLSATAAREADLLLSELSGSAYRPGTGVHPGDPFGMVLAWIWSIDPDRAMVLLADYLAPSDTATYDARFRVLAGSRS